ncbi:MAG: endonuclease/exonuclease/phosphatase family protein [Gammaproteobacteria bacterium]
MKMLTAMTWNVHGCIGTDRRFDPERIAGIVMAEAPAVVAMQEVYDQHHDGQALIEWFAARLEMHAVKGDVCNRRGCDYGNVIFTSLPVRETLRHDLAVEAREPRGALEVICDFQGTRMQLITTHFGLNRVERRAQVRRLAGLADARTHAATILLGDFNELRADGPVMRELTGRMDAAPPVRTYPSRMPVFPLDRCFVSGLQVIDSRVSTRRKARIASDHLPLIVKAAFPP